MGGSKGRDVHVLVVSDVDTRPDLSVSTARAAGALGAEAEEVEQAVSLGRLLELTLLRPECGRVLFNYQLCALAQTGAQGVPSWCRASL